MIIKKNPKTFINKNLMTVRYPEKQYPTSEYQNMV